MIDIDKSACTGCGTCALVCPQRVIDIAEKTAWLVAEDRCMECGACELNCHTGAVKVTKGTGCLAAIAKEMWWKRGRKAGSCGEETSAPSGCGCG